VVLSGWELRNLALESGEVEEQEGNVFHSIHDGSHPDVKAYVDARKKLTLQPAVRGAVQNLVPLFEPEVPQQLQALSSSKQTSTVIPSLCKGPERAVLGTLVVSTMPQNETTDTNAVQIRRSDRQPGPGFHTYRQDEDSQLHALSTSAKKQKIPVRLSTLEKTEEDSTDLTPMSGSFSRIGSLGDTVSVQEDLPARYPVRQPGMDYYAFQQSENDRLAQLKKRPRGGGGGEGGCGQDDKSARMGLL
jgi:hypothetical protein